MLETDLMSSFLDVASLADRIAVALCVARAAILLG